MQLIFIVLGVFVTALLGTFFHFMLPLVTVVSFFILGYLMWQKKQKGFIPQSDTYKKVENLKKKRVKSDKTKHKHINDQVSYIAKVWGYSKEQEKTIAKFVEGRAYSAMYNKLTASLLPQIIILIDNCNARGQKGCKREVSKRLRELTNLMKVELKKKKSQNHQGFETTLEVYDHLLMEIR